MKQAKEKEAATKAELKRKLEENDKLVAQAKEHKAKEFKQKQAASAAPSLPELRTRQMVQQMLKPRLLRGCRNGPRELPCQRRLWSRTRNCLPSQTLVWRKLRHRCQQWRGLKKRSTTSEQGMHH